MDYTNNKNFNQSIWRKDDFVWVLKIGDYYFSSDAINVVIDGVEVQIASYITDLSFEESVDYKNMDKETSVEIEVVLSSETQGLLNQPLSLNVGSLYLVSKSLGWDEKIPYIINALLYRPQYISSDEPIAFSLKTKEGKKKSSFPYVRKISEVHLEADFTFPDLIVERDKDKYTNFIWGAPVSVMPVPVIQTVEVVDADPYTPDGGISSVAGFVGYTLLHRVSITGAEEYDDYTLAWTEIGGVSGYTKDGTSLTYNDGVAVPGFAYGTVLEIESGLFVQGGSWAYDQSEVGEFFITLDGTQTYLSLNGETNVAACLRFLLSFVQEEIDWADVSNSIDVLERYNVGFWVNDESTDIKEFINTHFGVFGVTTGYTSKGLTLVVRPHFSDIVKDCIFELVEDTNCTINGAITENNDDVITGVALGFGTTISGLAKTQKVVNEGNISSNVGLNNAYGWAGIAEAITYEEGTPEVSAIGNINITFAGDDNIKEVESIVINDEGTASIVANEIMFWEGRPTIQVPLDVSVAEAKKLFAGALVKYVNADLNWTKYGYVSKFSLDASQNIEIGLTLLDI